MISEISLTNPPLNSIRVIFRFLVWIQGLKMLWSLHLFFRTAPVIWITDHRSIKHNYGSELFLPVRHKIWFPANSMQLSGKKRSIDTEMMEGCCALTLQKIHSTISTWSQSSEEKPVWKSVHKNFHTIAISFLALPLSFIYWYFAV